MVVDYLFKGVVDIGEVIGDEKFWILDVCNYEGVI